MEIKNNEESSIWCIKETYSVSGCRTDYIYGYFGIGSPHAHLVLFNQEIEWHRNLSGLNIIF